MTRRVATRLNCTIVFVVIGLLASSSVAADTARWRFDLPVFVSLSAHLQEHNDSRHRIDTLSTFIEARLSPLDKDWSVAGFVDFRVSPDDAVADRLNAGLNFRHRYSDWDTLMAVFHSHTRGGQDRVGYFGRVRYRVARAHRFGVESFGTRRQLERSFLMLGYYGDVSQSLSLVLVAGSSIGDGRDRAARAELVWQFH